MVFKYKKWHQYFYFFEFIFFSFLPIGGLIFFIYSIYKGELIEIYLSTFLCLMFFPFEYVAILMLKVINKKIEITEKSIILFNNNFSKEYLWDEIGSIEEYKTLQLFFIYNKNKKLLFVMDYILPELETLITVIENKIKEPKSSINYILENMPHFKLRRERILLKKNEKKEIVITLFILSLMMLSVYLGEKFENLPGEPEEILFKFLLVPFLFFVFLISFKTLKKRTVIKAYYSVLISFVLSPFIILFLCGYVLEFNSNIGKQINVILEGRVIEKISSKNCQCVKVYFEKLDNEYCFILNKNVFQSLNKGDKYRKKMIKGGLGIYYTYKK